MKGRDERKGKISLSDKIALAALFLAACDFILSWTPSLFRLPRFAFVLIFLAMLWSWAACPHDSWKEISRTYSDLRCELGQLREAGRKDEKLQYQYGHRADCLKEKYYKRIRKQLKRGMQKLALRTGILLMFCVGNYRPLAAFGQDFLRACGIIQESSGQQPDESNQGVPQEKGDRIEKAERESTKEAERESTEEEPEKEEQEQTYSRAPKPPNYRFVLEAPYFDQRLEDNIEEQVFFIDHGESSLDDYVSACMDEITECGYQGADYKKVRDENGNGYLTYTAQEDSFKARVDKSFGELYYADWLDKAPKSSEMEKYMNGRALLNMVSVDGRQGCHELWWAMANDHQYYAQEYETQTSNENAILYHYGMSIHCCMEALKYEMPKEKRDMVYHYMVRRYHDMCRENAAIPPIYKKQAASVHAVLVKDDPLKETE